MGTVLILPVVRIEREATRPAAGADRKRVQPPAAVAVGAPDIGRLKCRRCAFRSGPPGFGPTGSRAALIGAALGGCSGGDFGRTREDFRNDDMHRWLGGRRPAVSAWPRIPAHRKRAPAPRSRLSPDRAAAFAPRLEERVRRLSAAAFAMAAEGRVRPHRLWARADRRAAPLAHLALLAIDRGRAQRHHPVRAVLCLRARVIELDRKRNASLKLVSELSPREHADAIARMEENTLIVQWVQHAWSGGSLVPLGARAAGDPGAGQYRSRRRPPDRRTRRPNRQSAGRRNAGHRPRRGREGL